MPTAGIFKYSARNLTPTLRNLRVEGYFTQVKHFMSDSQRTSAAMGSWMMASDASTQTIGGRAEADLGRDFTIGMETYQRNWNMLGYKKTGNGMTANPAIPDVNTRTVGSFLNYRHAITDRLAATAGLRFDHAQMQAGAAQASSNLYYQFHNTRRLRNIDNYVSGNARLNLALPKSMELFAGVGTTGRIPDAEERYIYRAMGPTVGNPLLPITRNTEFTTGWSADHTRFYLRPAFFYSFLNNFILVNNQPQLNSTGTGTGSMGGVAIPTARSYANVDARIYGGEVTYNVVLTRSFSLGGGGSYSRGVATPRASVNVFSRNLPEMPPLRCMERPALCAQMGLHRARRHGSEPTISCQQRSEGGAYRRLRSAEHKARRHISEAVRQFHHRQPAQPLLLRASVVLSRSLCCRREDPRAWAELLWPGEVFVLTGITVSAVPDRFAGRRLGPAPGSRGQVLGTKEQQFRSPALKTLYKC